MHVPNTKDLEAAPVRPKDVIAPRADDGALSDLCPSLQVSEPVAFSEVPYQVNKTVLCKEVHYTLAPQAPCIV